MATDGETLGQLPKRLAVGTTDANPVFRGALEKVQGARLQGQQFGQQATAQAEPCIKGVGSWRMLRQGTGRIAGQARFHGEVVASGPGDRAQLLRWLNSPAGIGLPLAL